MTKRVPLQYHDNVAILHCATINMFCLLYTLHNYEEKYVKLAYN